MEQNNIVVDSTIFALINANAMFDEEQFYLQMISGNAMRRYQLSPKHAKRLMLLLTKNVGEYEKQFGELKTALSGGVSKRLRGANSGSHQVTNR